MSVRCCFVLPLHEGRTVGLPSAVLAARSSRHLLAMPTIGSLTVAAMAAGLASIAPDDVSIIITTIVAVGVYHLREKFMLLPFTWLPQPPRVRRAPIKTDPR